MWCESRLGRVRAGEHDGLGTRLLLQFEVLNERGVGFAKIFGEFPLRLRGGPGGGERLAGLGEIGLGCIARDQDAVTAGDGAVVGSEVVFAVLNARVGGGAGGAIAGEKADRADGEGLPLLQHGAADGKPLRTSGGVATAGECREREGDEGQREGAARRPCGRWPRDLGGYHHAGNHVVKSSEEADNSMRY